MTDPVPESASPGEKAAGLSRIERRVKAAQDVIRTTIRDLYLSHFGEGAVPASELEVNLSLRIQPVADWQTEFNPPLMEQLLPQLAGVEAARDVFVAGHVYCFRCASSGCEHTNPPSPRHVFKGYDATGRPEWQEFVQTLINEKHQRVDQLYLKPPRLVAYYQFGRALKDRQLTSFGKTSLSYSILGQVVAGYFQFNNQQRAITFQVVEGRARNGELSLKLNPISHNLDGGFLVEWLSAENSATLFRAILIAERELSRIEQKVITARAAREHDRANREMGRIPGVMSRLAEGLERGDRQGDRRTRHVEERRQDQRPVHKAMEDAASAAIGSCYYDEKAGTYVVVAERGRTHAFNNKGRHVTSFMIKPGAVAFRLRTRRWRPVETGEWRDILRSLNQRGKAPQEVDS